MTTDLFYINDMLGKTVTTIDLVFINYNMSYTTVMTTDLFYINDKISVKTTMAMDMK